MTLEEIWSSSSTGVLKESMLRQIRVKVLEIGKMELTNAVALMNDEFLCSLAVMG